MDEYGVFGIAVTFLVVFLSVSQLILKIFFRREHQYEDKIVEGRKYRKEHGTYDPNDFIESRSYIKSPKWLKQQNKGIRSSKKIKLRSYIGESKTVIGKKGL